MTYASVVAGDNPLHWWRFADPGGAIAHDIGSSPTILAGNTVTAGYSGPSSDGGSFLSDGNSGCGRFSYRPFSVTAPLSLEFWVWPFWNRGTLRSLVMWDNVTNPSIDVVWLATSVLQTSYNGQGPLNSGAAMSDEHWHYVVLTHDGSNIRLYLDDVLQQTVAYAATPTFNKTFGVGNEPSNGFQASAFFADLAIYAYALTATQIGHHFAAADQVGQTPVYQALGTFPNASNGVSLLSTDTSDILNAVQKTFPTT